MRPLARILAPCALALATAACVDYTPVVVTGFSTITATAHGCTADSGGTPLVSGVLDSNKGTGYLVGIKVQNYLGDNTDKNRTNTNQAIIDSVSATYRVGTGAAFAAPSPATTHLSAIIPSGGVVGFPAEILTPDNGQGLQGQQGELLVDVVLSGHYGDGSTFTTPKATFPVQVCTDCVAACAEGTHPAGCSVSQPDGFVCE